MGCILIMMYTCASAISSAKGINYPSYLFYLGQWSLPNTFVYILMIFGNSGLRCNAAITVSLIHTVLFYSFFFLGFHSTYTSITSPEVFYLIGFIVMTILSKTDIENQVRQGFLLKCEVGEDLRRQDELILSILPAEISDALKTNKIEDLAKYYDNVTIMFCTIVDFGRKSSSQYAQVTFISRINVAIFYDYNILIFINTVNQLLLYGRYTISIIYSFCFDFDSLFYYNILNRIWWHY